MQIAFLDIEASGLSGASYPVEVGVALAGKEGALTRRAWLIRPPDSWERAEGAWDPAAVALTGLTPGLVRARGLLPGAVVQEIAPLMASAAAVYSDAPEQDGHWLAMLFRAAGMPVPVALRDVMELDRLQRKMTLSRARQAWEAQLARVDADHGLRRHRAGPDAERLARAWLRLIGVRGGACKREQGEGFCR